MAQKKNSKESGKMVEAKSAAAGKIKKKKKSKLQTKGTTSDPIAQMAENVQKVMESTKETVSKKRKPENLSGDKPSSSKVANKNGNKKSKGANQQKNKNNNNKKQKKNHPDTKKQNFDKNSNAESTKDDGNDEAKWSKSKKKRIRALKAKQQKKQQQQLQKEQSQKPSAAKQDNSSNDANGDSSTPSNNPNGSSKLQDAFKARLSGSRFRILNEELYTQASKDSFERFQENPQLFEQYHQGFRHQVASWPVNPVDIIVRWMENRYSTQIHNNTKKKSANNKSKKVVVADFGCGDAQLAKDLMQRHEDSFQVHSFDLVSPDPKWVTACDMANVPLPEKSVDVVVFCLALMGTNLADFIREAHRVLKDNGRIQIAEVRSRIEYSHGRNNKKDNNNSSTSLSGTLDEFVKVLSQLGFECAKTDRSSNKMFLFLELKKNGKEPNQTLEFSAKPCIYKRR